MLWPVNGEVAALGRGAAWRANTCCLGGTRLAQGASTFFLASQAGFGWELCLGMHSCLDSLARWHVESVGMSSGVRG